MKYFNKRKMNDEFCKIIELIFRKTDEILIPEDFYKKRKYN